ncbi:MAG: HlyD family efflux transporter periplasmic adaptor subunit, partial [Acutalibacteraceae bacterium]
HQIYSSAYKPITTASAEYYTAVNGFNITGIIIREEKIIASDTSGTLHFVLDSGERVAKNGVIANIYSDAEASVTINRIEQLKSQIADIEEMQSYNDVEAADISLVNTKVTNSLNSLVRECATRKYSSIDEYSLELLTNMSRRQMITGEQTDFSARLAELNTELDTLSASLPQAVGYITTDTSGYFVSSIDGYENLLSCDDIDNITPEFLDSLKAEEINENAVGKIVSGYVWYIAAKVSIEDSMQYKTGDTLTVKTSLKSNPELNVTVEKINTSKSDDSVVLILSCQQMNSELASMRKGNMTIIKSTYSGLKLPKKALRVQDGKTGVFVRSGATLKFVTVNVIYSTDEYIICEQQTSNDDVLRLYDDVVVKGKRLYDGKIVD